MNNMNITIISGEGSLNNHEAIARTLTFKNMETVFRQEIREKWLYSIVSRKDKIKSNYIYNCYVMRK